MGLADWWRRVAPPLSAWDGTAGSPPSGNGASSFHLFWDTPPGTWTSAEVTFEILQPPAVAKLYFWALQVGFADRGRSGGAGHLGPQGGTTHPGGTAVNWGGYGADGRELDGSRSPLPSGSGNVNTRDYSWHPHTPYRLRVYPLLGAAAAAATPAPPGRTPWRGEIVDLSTGITTVVRELWAAGTTIDAPMMWSEVFADCDDPSVVVRWSDPTVIDARGERARITGVRTNYQSLADGGCANTDITVDGVGFVQATNTIRTTPPGARLRVER
jgi:hypothetical protein